MCYRISSDFVCGDVNLHRVVAEADEVLGGKPYVTADDLNNLTYLDQVRTSLTVYLIGEISHES